MAMIRLGLCCAFRQQPIKFRTTTATSLRRLSRAAALEKLRGLCQANAEALLAALQFCAAHQIGCFRIMSQILPVITHPELGYRLEELPGGAEIVLAFQACGEFAQAQSIRTCFHPDQFVVLNSRKPQVVTSSLRELEYHAAVAPWVGADVINIHAGGAFGNKSQALDDFCRNVERLSPAARQRLTIENDDTTFTPADLLPVCRQLGIPLVYDVHHHRCLPDEMSIEAATDAALETWRMADSPREPLFHLSSPWQGWQGPQPRRHHDEIDTADFPNCWRELDLTVEVEAKAKETAVLKLAAELPNLAGGRRRVPARSRRVRP